MKIKCGIVVARRGWTEHEIQMTDLSGRGSIPADRSSKDSDHRPNLTTPLLEVLVFFRPDYLSEISTGPSEDGQDHVAQVGR